MLLDSTKQKQICLCEQENEKLDRILNKWNVHFPVHNEARYSAKFELECFYIAFLGVINYEILNFENEIPFGLSYYISCNENDCLVIINRGYGSYNPIVDIQYQTLRCTSCNKHIKNIKCIQTIILHQTSGSITFKLKEENEHRRKDFCAEDSKLILFGEKLEIFDKLVIETNPLKLNSTNED